MPEPKVAALIPAAGRSERMGCCKMLLPLPDRPVIIRCIETIRLAGINDIVVVLASPHGTTIHEKIDHLPVTVAWNCNEGSDMAGSLKVGLEHLPADATGVLVFLPDTPLVTPETCEMLCERHTQNPTAIFIPTHAGRRGHPLLLPRVVIDQLPDYPTLRDLLQLRQELINLCPTEDAGILLDMDTPEDYEQLKRM
ncbi:2-C-methyl-D-erythritol 4-phosphate cytidylyltransferase [Geobacter sp. OR-1]|uniref:nucleotidyltransferase family protein n=1 Tax=Geobacter sp. OR-1 TaxID=1266765 RepID=UPI000544407C|nr:nucleotidyltransferase family protein [Geobacter sp. OR-1]GAM09891.1 2-C-methyl-D-erythritol 4-phosphate cytidylyltransferase [Geobacter sp. OR-1]